MDAIYGEGLLRELAQRAHDPLWLGLWSTISFLGSADFFTLLLPLLFAVAPSRFAFRFTSRVMIAGWLSELLKWWIGRPRLDPLLLGAERVLEHAGPLETDAFPSGHALMAVVVWIGWARDLKARRWLGLALVLVLGIAFSRLALLRHDLLDVAAGLAIGALLLYGLEWMRRRLKPWNDLPWVELAGLWTLAGLFAQRLVPTAGAAMVSGALVGSAIGVAQQRLAVAEARLGMPRPLLALFINFAAVALLRFAAQRWADESRFLLFALYAVAGWWIASAPDWLRRRSAPKRAPG